jgi:hypothetical protein
MQLAVGTIRRSCHAVLQLLRTLLVARAELCGPLSVDLGNAISGVLDHRAQGLGGRPFTVVRPESTTSIAV